MKKRHYFLTAVISYFILLIITFPAKPVTNLINDNTPITMQGVSGTLWSGKVYAISVNNIKLQRTKWSINLWKLLIGKIAIDVDTRFLDNDITTELGTSFLGRYFVNNLSAKIPAPDAAQLANIPFAQLDGMFSFNIDHAHWKQGELPLATGEIKWANAAITVADTASLGNISILLSESEQQLLNAEIKNQGGDIRISGTAELVPEADYSVELKLLPTETANDNIKQSLGLFSQKQPNGEYVLKKSGSLHQIM